MSSAPELARLYDRDLRRLKQEIAAFPDTDSLWKTVPGVTNSAGNLALHLEGNLRHFVGRPLGKVDYTRDRPEEFSAKGLLQPELLARIEDLLKLIPAVIGSLSDAVLDAPHPDNPLGEPAPTRQALVHLYGHLSWHLGQIDYLRRMLTADGAISLAAL